MKKFVLLLTLIFLLACSSTPVPPTKTPDASQATYTPEANVKPIPTYTRTPTIFVPSETPSPTPTLTPIPEAIREKLIQTYKVLLFIQIDATLLNETATRVQSGELQGFDSLGAVIALAALVGAVDDVLPEIDTPDFMRPHWDNAMQAHAMTKDILSRWFDKEIDSKVVMEEVVEPLENIETVLSEVENELSSLYGFDPQELKVEREEALASVSEIFSTPTPFPIGEKPALEVLGHMGFENGSWYNIIGEVKNNSDKPMEFVKVIATLYDDSNQVVGTSSSYTYLDVIPAGGKAPFELSIDEWGGTTHHKVQVQGSIAELQDQVLEINSHHSYIEGNWYKIIGEVKNNHDKPMGFVKVVITLYDDKNNVVGTGSTYTTLDIIPPRGNAPFEISTDNWEGATHYEVQVQGSEDILPKQDLTVPSHSKREEGSWLTIQGEVKNNSSAPAEFVKVIATLYDAEGDVVGIITTYTSLDKIPAGGTSPFEGSTNYWAGFDHYEIQVQGQD